MDIPTSEVSQTSEVFLFLLVNLLPRIQRHAKRGAAGRYGIAALRVLESADVPGVRKILDLTRETG